MRAYILAGGKGTRLSSINTEDKPKCLVEIAGKSILEWQLLQLKKYDINDVIIITCYKAELINDWIKEKQKDNELKNQLWGLNIIIVTEETPMGTGGIICALSQALLDNEDLNEPFLVIYGDIIFNFNFNDFINYSRGKTAVVVTHQSDHPHDSSCVEIENNEIIKWWKKGQAPNYCDTTVTGIRYFDPKLFENFENSVLDLEEDILKPYLNNGKIINTYYTDEFIKDIGTPERFIKVEKIIQEGLYEK